MKTNKKLKEIIYQKWVIKSKIDIKNWTYYFFDDVINIKNFNPNNIKVDEKYYKDILTYYIRYVTIKDSKYVKFNGVNPLYLIFSKVNGYSEEINGNKYLTLVPTNKNKQKNIYI